MGRKIGKPGKGKAQKKHALSRAEQRLGFRLTEKEYETLISKIQNNKFKLVEKQSNRVSKFIVKIRGKEVIAVYDKNRKSIITFLYQQKDIEEDSILEKVFGWLKKK